MVSSTQRLRWPHCVAMKQLSSSAVSSLVRALAHLCADPTDDFLQIQDVLRGGAAPRLAELLTHPSSAVRLPALHVVCNISLGMEAQVDLLIEGGVLRRLLSALEAASEGERKIALNAISNGQTAFHPRSNRLAHHRLSSRRSFALSSDARFCVCQ